jgi:hypothetical protein
VLLDRGGVAGERGLEALVLVERDPERDEPDQDPGDEPEPLRVRAQPPREPAAAVRDRGIGIAAPSAYASVSRTARQPTSLLAATTVIAASTGPAHGTDEPERDAEDEPAAARA